jgi:hypothetical protein
MSIKFKDDLPIQEIQQILLFNQEGDFTAIPETAKMAPLTKGIYFWYVLQEGLPILSKYLVMPIQLEEPITKLNNKILIYLGTAGARLTENNQGHLKQRLLWHICTKHRPSTINNGTLSTFRTTLGSLLNHDLISHADIQTEQLINDFMKKYLSVSYIQYDGPIYEAINAINEDERVLIKSLKPLFNLKNNPNAKIKGHSTKAIKTRRILINKNSKLRLV